MTALAEFKQLVQVRARVPWFQERGEDTVADEIAPVPLPASMPPKVVEPVPPTFTVRVEEEVNGDEPLPINGWPAVVVVAVKLPVVRVPDMRESP